MHPLPGQQFYKFGQLGIVQVIPDAIAQHRCTGGGFSGVFNTRFDSPRDLRAGRCPSGTAWRHCRTPAKRRQIESDHDFCRTDRYPLRLLRLLGLPRLFPACTFCGAWCGVLCGVEMAVASLIALVKASSNAIAECLWAIIGQGFSPAFTIIIFKVVQGLASGL